MGRDLRTLSFTLGESAGTDQIRVITAGSRETLAESRFDAGTEGWGIVGGAVGPRWEATTGNPGGAIRGSDAAPDAWRWNASAEFLGDQLAAYRGALSFDMRQTPNNDQFQCQDVQLIGPGLTLQYDTPYNPAVD